MGRCRNVTPLSLGGGGVGAHKSLGSLFGDIKKKIDNALGNEVAEIVKEMEQQSTIYEVYAMYTPVMYGRRGDAGGLGSMDNMVSQVSGGTLTVTNETPFSQNPESGNYGNNLDELVEYGDGGGGHNYEYTRTGLSLYKAPRPFIQKTKETLAEGGGAIPKTALEIGLERQGLTVK